MKKISRLLRVRHACVLALFLGLTGGTAEAGSFNLLWDRNGEPDVVGYRVHWGTSATALPNVVNVGNQITYFFTEPDPTRAYYFAVQAYNSAGLSSPLSTAIASTPGAFGLSLNRGSLSFAVTKNGAAGPIVSITPGQEVRVSYAGPVPVWTATSNQPWLQIITGSGTGAGRFTVALGNIGTGVGTYTATVTVSAPNVGQSRTLPVSVTIRADGASGAPVGAFDTPATGAAIQGSIAVTGWALDDLGMNRVELWRDPVGNEPRYTGGGLANGKVFIATALFVDGARPDVEAAYSTAPMAYRAGWGYLLLTWGLPEQGNGTFTLHAFAFDNQNQGTSLGSKSISSNNAQATVPFGGLDTPGYGQVVSGGVWVYGWTLTPRPNTTDGRTCSIPASGVRVSVDSGALVPVTYGAARTDIAGSFPGFSNTATAGGAYYLNTATLSNGIHTIGWLVTDSCGRTDGIGSRSFLVQNGGAADRPAPITTQASPAAAPDWSPIAVRQNDGEELFTYPSGDGVHVLAVEQTSRIDVQLPASAGPYSGSQVINGERRALPTGSSLDAEKGVFSWQPATGFLGSFELAFGSGGSAPEVRMRAVVGPAMRTTIDTLQTGEAVQPFVVAGWALDLAAASGSGIDTVHVWAYPAAGGAPIFLGEAATGDERPDVAAVYGDQFAASSYSLLVNRLEPGAYDVVVYPHRASTGTFEGAQVSRVVVR